MNKALLLLGRSRSVHPPVVSILDFPKQRWTHLCFTQLPQAAALFSCSSSTLQPI